MGKRSVSKNENIGHRFVDIISELRETSQKRVPKLQFIIDSMYNCFGVKPLERKIDFVNKLEQSSGLEPEFISGFI